MTMNYDERYEQALNEAEDFADVCAKTFCDRVYKKLGLGEPPQVEVNRVASAMAEALALNVAAKGE